MVKKKTIEQFIEEARVVHGDKYDYSKVEYKNNKTKVKIICPKHGPFWQIPINHFKGKGCPKCGRKRSEDSHRKTTEQFIQQAQKIHGNKYDYSKVEYKGRKTKVEIICPKHGPFWQTPNNHLGGCGCPECGKAHVVENRTKTIKQFIAEARAVHGDKYDYGKTKYVDAKTKVEIICPKHGPFFQIPDNHINKESGCPSCATHISKSEQEIADWIRKELVMAKRKTTTQFIKEARKIHGDKYDYSKVNYVNSYSKICIICPEHGPFWQDPHAHLKGKGCPKCAGNQKLTTEEFITRAQKIHGDKYDYSKVDYKNKRTKVCIICPEHGEFWQTPHHHAFYGHGCPKCAKIKTTNLLKNSKDNFIEKACAVHGDRYDYSKVEYVNSYTKVEIVCPKHGSFWQIPNNHLSKGDGCPRCATRISKPEQEIVDWIGSGDFEIIQSYRGWDKERFGLEIDVFIPALNLGIEFNGNRWHSSQFHPDPKWHQQEKTLLAAEAGIRLITVPEWVWYSRKRIVENIIRNALGVAAFKISARKCQLVEISSEQAKEFHESNHIHGFVGATVHLALFYDGQPVSVMSLIARKGQWEIARYSSSCLVRGGFSRLFRAFERQYDPKVVISYADARFWTGCSYRSVGFVLDGITDPGYVYVNIDGGMVGNRQKFQKHKLKKLFGESFDPLLTEEENCARNGLYRLYDCGHWKWVWQKK